MLQPNSLDTGPCRSWKLLKGAQSCRPSHCEHYFRTLSGTSPDPDPWSLGPEEPLPSWHVKWYRQHTRPTEVGTSTRRRRYRGKADRIGISQQTYEVDSFRAKIRLAMRWTAPTRQYRMRSTPSNRIRPLVRTRRFVHTPLQYVVLHMTRFAYSSAGRTWRPSVS